MAEIPGDTYDPCASFIELRTAYHEALKGGAIRRVRFRNGDEERETEFDGTNLEALKAAMDQAQRECIAKTNGRPVRSAIGIGRHLPRNGRIY